MRIFFLSILFLFLIPYKGDSQTVEEQFLNPYQKNEHILTVGVFPVAGMFTLDPNSNLKYFYAFHHTDFVISMQDTFKTTMIGSLNYGYYRNINKYLALGVSYSVAVRNNYISINREGSLGLWPSPEIYLKYKETEVYQFIQFSLRHTLYRNKSFFVYHSIFLGLTLGYAYPYQIKGIELNPRIWIFPNMHINIIGIGFSESFPLHLEFGLGNQGLIKAGFRF